MTIPKALVTSVVFLLLGCHTARAALTMTPGTILGVDSVTNELRQYSFAGTLTGTLGLALGNYGTGVAIIGNRVFVTDYAGIVQEVNLNTGAVSFVFNSFGGGYISALGDNGTNLLTYNYGTGTVREYTTAGALVNTFTLAGGGSLGINGLDAYGNRIFAVRDVLTQDILEFNTSGALVNTISTGLASNADTSGLGYDPTDGSFWISSSGDDKIRHYSATGTLLTSFATGSPELSGLDIVPANVVVPEPGGVVVWSLLAGTSAAVVVARKQRRRATRGRWTDENRAAILALINDRVIPEA